MSGVEAIAAAAKTEIVKIESSPVRVSCPSCGRHLASVLVVPNLLRCRCQNDKCRTDVVALVAKDGSVLVSQDK